MKNYDRNRELYDFHKQFREISDEYNEWFVNTSKYYGGVTLAESLDKMEELLDIGPIFTRSAFDNLYGILGDDEILENQRKELETQC